MLKNFPHAAVYRVGTVMTFCLFMVVMITVCTIGMTRKSGVTGIDVSALKSLGKPLVHDEEQSSEEMFVAEQ